MAAWSWERCPEVSRGLAPRDASGHRSSVWLAPAPDCTGEQGLRTRVKDQFILLGGDFALQTTVAESSCC